MSKIHLSCNQAMVLLEAHRGTFSPDHHYFGTLDNDLQYLTKNELVRFDDGDLTTTALGDERVKEMLG